MFVKSDKISTQTLNIYKNLKVLKRNSLEEIKGDHENDQDVRYFGNWYSNPVLNQYKSSSSSSSFSSSSFTDFYNSLAGFSFLILEVSRSHTATHHSR
jgi:hypothetical protein